MNRDRENRWRTASRRGYRTAWLPALLALWLAGGAGATAGRAPEPNLCQTLSSAEIVERVLASHKVTDSTMQFRQRVRLRAGLLRWEFQTQAVRRGRSLQVHIENGPWFLPEEVSSTIVDPADLVERFDFQKDGFETRGDQLQCILQGKRKPGAGGGVEEGRVWIETRRWLLTRIIARYWWGTLAVDLEYGTWAGRVVPIRQRASIESMGIQMDVEYLDYVFL